MYKNYFVLLVGLFLSFNSLATDIYRVQYYTWLMGGDYDSRYYVTYDTYNSMCLGVNGYRYESETWIYIYKDSYLSGSTCYSSYDVYYAHNGVYKSTTKDRIVMISSIINSCPLDTELNTETGECETPPPDCGDGYTYSDLTESCLLDEDPEDCDAGYIYNSALEQCVEDCPSGYLFDSSLNMCMPDSSSCDESNNWCDSPDEPCTLYSSNWDTCKGDYYVEAPSIDNDLTVPDISPFPEDNTASVTGEIDAPEVSSSSSEKEAIAALNEDLNQMSADLQNLMNTNFSDLHTDLAALNDSIFGTTTAVIDAANSINDTIENQSNTLIEASNNTNKLLESLNGVTSDGTKQIVNAINGLGDIQVEVDVDLGLDSGSISYTGEDAPPLYDSDTIPALNSEINDLVLEYDEWLDKFKTYLLFEVEVDSGEFNRHDLNLNWRGTEINQPNQALIALLNNSYIISQIVFFAFGMLGIYQISRSL